jgi:hypothetical protein
MECENGAPLKMGKPQEHAGGHDKEDLCKWRHSKVKKKKKRVLRFDEGNAA